MTSKSYADVPTRLTLTTLFVAVRVTVESSVHTKSVRHKMLTFYAIILATASTATAPFWIITQWEVAIPAGVSGQLTGSIFEGQET